MGQPYKIIMRVESTNEPVELSGHIPCEDWSKLLRFRDEADRLIEYLIECGDLNVNFSVNWNSVEGIFKVETENTYKDIYMSVILHRLRPFQLNDEPSCFYRMVNTLNRYMKHDILNMRFKFFKDLFSGKNFQSQMIVTLMSDDQKDIIVNSEKTIMTWIYAYEYHRDDEKQRFIKDLDKVMPVPLSRSIFKSMLIDKIKAVTSLRDMIYGIERGGSASV